MLATDFAKVSATTSKVTTEQPQLNISLFSPLRKTDMARVAARCRDREPHPTA
jgi:hypothetical protein